MRIITIKENLKNIERYLPLIDVEEEDVIIVVKSQKRFEEYNKDIKDYIDIIN